jgi:hypothetical protein
VRLGPFELLTARFFPADVNLRTLWQEAQDRYAILSEYDVSASQVLQAASLRARSSAQRSDVLKLEAADITEHWDGVVRGIAGALELIKGECGALASRLLPYSMVVVPMAAVWNLIENAKGAARGAGRKKLERYFWCTVFMTNFDQGANSQAGADYLALRKWLTDGSHVPEAIGDFDLSTAQLAAATVSRRALYRGVMALTIRHGAKDFHLAQSLTRERLEERQIDAHHVFPKKWLADNYASDFPDDDEDAARPLSAELILNRALIDKETNRRIRARAPSAYLADIEEDLGESTVRDILDSHLIDADRGSGLLKDDYEQFITERLELVAAEIEDVTGKELIRPAEAEALAEAEGGL